MEDVDQIIAEVQNLLGSSDVSNIASSSASDIFEAYVFCLVLEAAKTEGANIHYRDVFNNPVTKLVFRTSPGSIFSTRHPYTHAVIEFPAKPVLEAHVGVRVVGKSRVLHECDVAVIEQVEAENCRQQNVPPRSRNVLIAVECKFYSTPLQLHLARAFIGLTSDMSTSQSLFVTNSSSDAVEKLLSARTKEWEHNIAPRYYDKVMRLRHKFQNAFQKFKAK